MAQGTITRLTYERLGILLTDAPAYKESGTKYTDLIRVQSMDYNFTHKSVDVKGIGSDSLLTKNGQSPVLVSPDVNCSIQYLFSEAKNEIAAGFYIGREASVLKNFLKSSSSDDINVVIVASNKDEHQDLNFLTSESDFDNYNVIGIGNAFLTNYTYDASVGQLASSSLSYTASNMKYDIYASDFKPTLPAVKPGNDNVGSNEEISLTKNQLNCVGHDREARGYFFDEHHIPEVSATKSGDIQVEIIKRSGDRGGAKLEQILAAVQSISINLPIERQDVFGMGSNYVFNRKLKLPVVGQISMDMVVRGYEPDQVELFMTKADVYDITVKHPVAKRIVGKEGSIYFNKNYLYIAIEENEWRRIAMKKIEDSLPDFNQITQHPKNLEYSISPLNLSMAWDENFFYIKNIQTNEYWSSPLIPTTEIINSTDNYFSTYTFIYLKHQGSWKKFPVVELNFDIMGLEESFDLAKDITIEINRAQLNQQNYTHTIGSEVMVSSSLSFDVTKEDGLRMYFQ